MRTVLLQVILGNLFVMSLIIIVAIPKYGNDVIWLAFAIWLGGVLAGLCVGYVMLDDVAKQLQGE